LNLWGKDSVNVKSANGVKSRALGHNAHPFLTKKQKQNKKQTNKQTNEKQIVVEENLPAMPDRH